MATLPIHALQFAVVREDPRLEAAIVRELRAKRVLLVASGGCTALHLRAAVPDADIVLVEPNPAQVAHVTAKLHALANFTPAAFNVGTGDATGLHECGNFERLFRVFRAVLDEFVVTAAERHARCADPRADWRDVVAHRYWPVAFTTAFAEELLLAMFGPAAVQHAVRGSYPGYFQRRLETGLAAADRATNPWLHHVLLGHYLDDRAAWPPFLQQPPRDLRMFPVLPHDLLAVKSFTDFDFVHLSNVLDWMDDAACRALADRLAGELRPGAAISWRQLNDPRPLLGYFAPAFAFGAARDRELTTSERALFYDQVHLGVHH
jgi:S-adenosylmethionine-diacylglycerol 3-amino-3-carboxypropyl transferase